MTFLTIALAATVFTWTDSGGRLELRENGSPVLAYVHEKQLANGAPELKRRSGYIHPVWAPNGAVVTDDFPRDHWHHRGIFWAWPVVRHGDRKLDIWTLTGGIDSRFVRWMNRKAGETAELGVENAWYIADREVLREQVRLEVSPAKNNERKIAVTLRLEAAGGPIELVGSPDNDKGYGGFSVRFAPRTDTVIRTDAGVEAKDTDMVPHPWAEMEANFSGKRARLRIEQGSDHPGFPAGWCLRKYGFLGVNYPGLKPLRLEPGRPVTLRYVVTVAELAALPPLVTPWEIEELKRQIADAAAGRRFLLQGGDCAESFADCTAPAITSKIKILLQMSLVLVHGIQKPVIRVGRFAGQYAKPRSAPVETRDGETLPAYRGDVVNAPAFEQSARMPDPSLMLRGYERAALTLNYVRALARGGFADLHHPENWDTGFIHGAELSAEYGQIVRNVAASLRFMENVLGVHADGMERVDLFTSHEGLLLPYEEAQTRESGARWYNLSTHFPWIGARTLESDGAHVEYFRGITNPVGVKVGPSLDADSLLGLLDTLDPAREPGRITLIHRFGHTRIGSCLPPVIRAVRASGRRVLWSCDPMHGNTRSTASGIKTRSFADILAELDQAFDIHTAEGSALGGVHFELSGENVTECIGGSSGVEEADLSRAYKSEVDPRLNYEQALEMAILIAHKLAH